MVNDPDIVHQKDYWDSLAPDKTFTHPLNLEKIRSIITPEQRILDYGCGYGRLCQELWKNGYQNILGVDISPKMIERGKQLFPYLNLKLLDIDRQYTETSSFDLVLLYSVLTCIPTNKGIEDLMNNIHRILSAGGYLYISDTLIQNNRRNVKRYEQFQQEFGIYGVFRLADGGVFRHFDIGDIRRITSKFEQASIDYLRIRTMNNHPARGFQYICKKVT